MIRVIRATVVTWDDVLRGHTAIRFAARRDHELGLGEEAAPDPDLVPPHDLLAERGVGLDDGEHKANSVAVARSDSR
jgi:hypothetical protein